MTARKPAPRPSLRRVHTPLSEAQRNRALNDGVKLSVDGVEYIVRAGDLTALDAAALRRECGYSFLGLLNALAVDGDIDLIAAVMWLSRRIKGESTLPYAVVASELGYDAVTGDAFQIEIENQGEEKPNPEA